MKNWYCLAIILSGFLAFTFRGSSQVNKPLLHDTDKSSSATNSGNALNAWNPDTRFLDQSAIDTTNLAGLDRDVKYFYELLRKKDWKAAYAMRWQTFRHDIPEEMYLDMVKENGTNWQLSDYQVLMVNDYGVDDATLICKFVELPGPMKSYAAVEWHRERDGVWRCNGAGPARLTISVATRHVQTPDDN